MSDEALDKGTPAGHSTNWGRWGDDDERGTLNLLTDQLVLQASKVCKTGKVYRLSLPQGRTGVPIVEYRGAPYRLSLLDDRDTLLAPYGVTDGTGACEDVLILPSHSVTHMDALSHVFADDKFYNGFPATGFTSNTGASRCGIEKNGGFVSRAVLLDIARDREVEWLPLDEVITAAQLAHCCESQGTEIREGDTVLVRTGWQTYFRDALARGDSVGYEQPGIGLEAAKYLASLDVSAVGSDNGGIEPMPWDQGIALGVHIELLVRHGISLIENMVLDGLANDRCYEALFIVAPLLVPGATGCPVNPIAIG